MGFFNMFNKASQQLPASCKYTWENVTLDSMIMTAATFDSFLFYNSKCIYNEYNGIIAKCTEEHERGHEDEANRIYDEARSYIENTVQRIHYEGDLQFSELQGIVGIALGDLFSSIEVVQNFDGQKSQQYFAGFSLNPDQVVETITQNVSQIISREHNLYLREYLTNLEEVKRYAEAFAEMQKNDGSTGSFLTGALGGAVALANPLIGLGIIAKGFYDGYQSDQRTNAQIEKLFSLRKKWSASFYKLRESEDNTCSKVGEFVGDKIGTAFNELGQAVSQYCNENRLSIDAVCDAIFQYRIDYGNVPSFNTYDENERAKAEAVLNISRNALNYNNLSQGLRSYCEKMLNSIR